MTRFVLEVSCFNTDSIDAIIAKGERLGYIVIPWRTSKKASKVKNTWYLNRRKQNKPHIVIHLSSNGRGLIEADGDYWDGFGGLDMNQETLCKEMRELYASFPKENYRKMGLRANDIRATFSRNRAFAFFPPGATSIIECILRHVKEGFKPRVLEEIL